MVPIDEDNSFSNRRDDGKPQGKPKAKVFDSTSPYKPLKTVQVLKMFGYFCR